MTESALMTKIKKTLEAMGLFVVKTHGGPMQMAGLPDLLVIKEGRAIWLEVKTDDGAVTKLQEIMLSRLRKAGCVAEVVRTVEDARCVVRVE